MKDERDIEKLLERFSPKPARPGLRDRVLHAAEQETVSRRILSRGWRWVLATSFVLIAAFTLADRRVSSAEQNLLDSFLRPRGTAVRGGGGAEQATEEILAYFPDLDPASRQALTRSLLRDQSASSRSRKGAPRLTEEINEY